MKKCILVLSPPRSGSSCITGCINLCGIPLGKNVAKVKDKFNKKGYFENATILRHNEKLLAAASLSWKTPKLIETKQAWQDGLRAIILEQYGNLETFAIKDPRLVILWKTYKNTLNSLDIKTSVVCIKRDKPSTVSSIIRLARVSHKRAEEIYNGYFKTIETIIKDEQPHNVLFEDLLRDPVGEVQRLCDFMGVEFTEEKINLIKDFIDQKMVNYPY